MKALDRRRSGQNSYDRVDYMIPAGLHSSRSPASQPHLTSQLQLTSQ